MAEPSPAAEGELEGRRILVTGGTTGIGRATACLLAAEGANLLIFGRHERELSDALKDVSARAKGTVIGMIADQARREEIDRVFQRVDEDLGGLDVLINNAGIAGDGLLESSYDDWDYLLHTNFLGHVACARKAIDRMRKDARGHIINIGSISAWKRRADDELYCASKAALQAFSESLRKNLANQGIRVSLIEPGAVGTDMNSDPPAKQALKEQGNELLMAEDIAECIRYILRQPMRVLVEQVRITPLRNPD